MAGDDWGLDAVVRSCRLSSSSSLPSSFPIKEEEENTVRFPDLVVSQTETGNDLHELEEFCKPFFSKPQQQPPKPSSFSPAAHRSISQLPRSKRRKNQQKKVVCHVPADGLGSDIWAWRKYGQKPIKGSPYPRGYYRCSSSKGCMARKQVERSRGDPGMLVVTYTAEHNHPAPTHRNSLAGSTRSKYSTTGGGPLSSPTTPLTVSMEDELVQRPGLPEKSGEEEDEEEELMVEDMEVVGEDELLFVGLDGEMSTEGGAAAVPEESDSSGLFDGGFFSPPLWLANNHNAAATAGAGGS